MKGFLQSDDRELLAGALTAERAAAGGYEALAGRCVTPGVRQKMLFLLGEEHRVEEELLEELTKRGWVSAPAAGPRRVAAGHIFCTVINFCVSLRGDLPLCYNVGNHWNEGDSL